MNDVKVLVFDLDDTLLDTTTYLIPQAAREACTAMIEAGLKTDLETAVRTRQEILHSQPRARVFAELVRRFGVRAGSEPGTVDQVGYNAFHNREINEMIELASEVRDMLRSLKNKYKLYLVTAGTPETQARKVARLGLSGFFESIHYVNSSQAEKKGSAFRSIMEATRAEPHAIMSVGNRIDTDIAEAKALGWQTCWVRYGEYIHMKAESPLETPDFEIDRVQDLAKQCHL
jgi:putative hydrolase of the HAD superfamily